MTIVSRLSSGAVPLLLLLGFLFVTREVSALDEARLGSIRVVFQLKYGDIEFGFYPEVAPKTVAHILKLVTLGAYNSNHFFRVDKGFVAQVADVVGGREAPLNREQREEGIKTIPGEFSRVKHVRGILSMGRYSDPDSAGSSFSMLLGNAPHLDGQYAVFGKVTKGYDTLAKLEELPTKTEGIFVMPLERINIMSSYYYDLADKIGGSTCEDELVLLRRRLTQATNFIEIQDNCFWLELTSNHQKVQRLHCLQDGAGPNNDGRFAYVSIRDGIKEFCQQLKDDIRIATPVESLLSQQSFKAS